MVRREGERAATKPMDLVAAEAGYTKDTVYANFVSEDARFARQYADGSGSTAWRRAS